MCITCYRGSGYPVLAFCVSEHGEEGAGLCETECCRSVPVKQHERG